MDKTVICKYFGLLILWTSKTANQSASEKAIDENNMFYVFYEN